MFQDLDNFGNGFDLNAYDLNAYDLNAAVNSTQWLEPPTGTSDLPYSLELFDFAVDADADADADPQSEQVFTDFPALELTPSSEFSFDANIAPSSSSSITSAPERDDAGPLKFDTDSLRWQALLSRSRLADSFFLYGVLSTKIYCRASCPSRRPIAANRVKYFPFPEAIENAEQLGFRACKRCMPKKLLMTDRGKDGDEKAKKGVGRAVVTIWEQAVRGKINTMDLIAKEACLSLWHFHRQFKVVTGLTPAEYGTACFALSSQDSFGTGCNTREHSGEQGRSEVSLRTRRRQQQVLAGLDSPSEKIFSTTCSTAYGLVCVAWSFGTMGHGNQRPSRPPIRIHALLIGVDAHDQMQIRFPHRCISSELQESVEATARDLHSLGKDRETDIPERARTTVRRAKLWTELTRKWKF